MAKKINQNQQMPDPDKPILNSEQQKIVEWLQTVRFKKQSFGGVSEADVWKKIDELNRLYEAALTAERIRYETLLKEYKTGDVPSGSEGGDE